MKPLHTLRALSLLTAIFSSGFIYALPKEGGCFKGKVQWDESKQPIISATIAFENEEVTKGFFTHEKGRYYACYIPEGVYTITVSFGATTITVPNVKVTDGEVHELNFSLPVDLPVVPFSLKPGYIKPDMHRDTTAHTPFITASNDAINGLPEFTVSTASLPAHKTQTNDDSEVTWYIDGCKVMGNPNVPVRGVESVLTYTGSIPAKYGDTNGVVMAIETQSLW